MAFSTNNNTKPLTKQTIIFSPSTNTIKKITTTETFTGAADVARSLSSGSGTRRSELQEFARCKRCKHSIPVKTAYVYRPVYDTSVLEPFDTVGHCAYSRGALMTGDDGVAILKHPEFLVPCCTHRVLYPSTKGRKFPVCGKDCCAHGTAAPIYLCPDQDGVPSSCTINYFASLDLALPHDKATAQPADDKQQQQQQDEEHEQDRESVHSDESNKDKERSAPAAVDGDQQDQEEGSDGEGDDEGDEGEELTEEESKQQMMQEVTRRMMSQFAPSAVDRDQEEESDGDGEGDDGEGDELTEEEFKKQVMQEVARRMMGQLMTAMKISAANA